MPRPSRREDLISMQGNKSLVGRNHVLALLDGAQHQLAGGVNATDEFDDHFDFRVIHDLAGLFSQPDAIGRANSRFGEVACTLADHLNGAATATRELLGVALENVYGSTAHRTEPEKAYTHLAHDGSPA